MVAEAGGNWQRAKPAKPRKPSGTHRVQRGFELLDRGVNLLGGLELHHNALTRAAQVELVEWCEAQLRQGRVGSLVGSTYMLATVPRRVSDVYAARTADVAKWERRQGREVLQYGVFYDYAAHRIAPGCRVESFPPELAALARKLCQRGVRPPYACPDSAIINVYAPGDCIPPHIDHEHYPRPFCAVSLLCDAPIQFGRKIGITGPGTFDAPFSLVLPRGSVVVFQGNAANVAQHCIPAVPGRRISITFRKIPDDVKPRIVN